MVHMARKKITFTCEEDIWKEFRKKAIEKDKEYSHYIEELIKKELK
jgi:hypothetical protein